MKLKARRISTTMLDALVALVDFAREHGGEERAEVRRAIKKVEPKIKTLRRKRERRAASPGRRCGACGVGANHGLCWKCWRKLPAGFRALWENAPSDWAKRQALEAAVDHLSNAEADAA